MFHVYLSYSFSFYFLFHLQILYLNFSKMSLLSCISSSSLLFISYCRLFFSTSYHFPLTLPLHYLAFLSFFDFAVFQFFFSFPPLLNAIHQSPDLFIQYSASPCLPTCTVITFRLEAPQQNDQQVT